MTSRNTDIRTLSTSKIPPPPPQNCPLQNTSTNNPQNYFNTDNNV